MAVSIKDLVKDLSKEELYDDFVEIGDALGLPASWFAEGEPAWGVLQIFAERFAEVWNRWIVRAIRAAFLDFAEDDWLTLKTSLDYETDRKEDAFASFKLVVVNKGPGFYTLAAGDIRIENSDHKTFRNVTGGTLAAWPGAPVSYPKVTLTFEADEAGSGSNTSIGGIVTTPLSAPSGVEVETNASPILGSERELDPDLRKRARLQPSTLAPAPPLSAYEYVALSAKRADGTSVDVTRVRPISAGGGVIKVYLAGASGPTGGDMATADTDVFIAWTAMALKALAVGLALLAYGATQKTVSFVLTLVVDRGSLLTSAEADAAASAAVNTYFTTLPIGGHRTVDGGPGYVFASEIQAKASESADGIVRAVATDLNGDPLEDYPLDEGDVAVPSYSVVVSMVKQ